MNDSIKIIKENRKSLSAEVYPNFDVIIKVPYEIKECELNDFIKRKSKWIEKQKNYFKQFNKLDLKSYESGNSTLYLGRQYQIIIEKAALKNKIKISKNKIFILSSNPQRIDDITAAFDSWLLSRAQIIFAERLKECLKSFPKLSPPSLKIRKLKKRWGSYLKKNEIVLNPDLIKANKNSIDYVIYHELCHAYYDRHTADFYNLLSTKMPNWKEVKEAFELKLLSY